jgi:hypothetical protein
VLVSLIFGVFFGALNQPTPSLVLSGLPPTALLAALPIYKLSAPIGTMLSFGICETFLDHRAALVQSRQAAAETLHNPGVASFIAHGGTAGDLAALTTSQAAVVADAALMFVLALATLLVIPMTFLIQVKKAPATLGQPSGPAKSEQTTAPA